MVSAAHEVGHAVQAHRFPMVAKWSPHRFRLFGGCPITSGIALIAGVLWESWSLVGQGVLYYSLLFLMSAMICTDEIHARRRVAYHAVICGTVHHGMAIDKTVTYY